MPTNGRATALAVCTDGKPVAQFERESAERAGATSVQAWRDSVIKALKGARATNPHDPRDPNTVAAVFGKGKSAAAKSYAAEADALARRFREVGAALEAAKWDSAQDLEDLLEGRAPGLAAVGVDRTGYTQFKRPMWWWLWARADKLAKEPDWQHTSAVSWVGPDGRNHYATNMTPYVVRRSGTSFDFPRNGIVKITTPDGRIAYAQVLGVGPAGMSKLELSQGVYAVLGYDASATNVPRELASVDYAVVDGGGASRRTLDERLTSDQIQLAGALGEAGMLPAHAGRALRAKDLENAVASHGLDPARLPPKLDRAMNAGARRALAAQAPSARTAARADSSTGPPGGVHRLATGYASVFAGPTMRKVGYADPACKHEGGGHVCEGSGSVFVGQYALARVGDPTSDGKAVLSGQDSILLG